jgi:hypothetical protein
MVAVRALRVRHSAGGRPTLAIERPGRARNQLTKPRGAGKRLGMSTRREWLKMTAGGALAFTALGASPDGK